MDKTQIVVNDGVANVTFKRIARKGDRLQYTDLSASTLSGRSEVVHEVVQPTERSAGRVTIGIKMPIIETVDGQPAMTRYYRHTSTTYLPPLGNAAERQRFKNLIKNLYAETDVQASFADLEPFG